MVSEKQHPGDRRLKPGDKRHQAPVQIVGKQGYK